MSGESLRRALVVDDAPTIRMYHRGILVDAGFEVTEAGNGLEALEAVLHRTFDLMVIDVNMPQMDGYTLLKRLRSPQVGVTTPVVAISTESDQEDADAAYRAGANLYLVKPVPPQVLRQVAEVLCAGQRVAGTPS